MEKKKWTEVFIGASCGNSQHWKYSNGSCEVILVRSHYHNRLKIQSVNREEKTQQEFTITGKDDLGKMLDHLAENSSGTYVDFDLEKHLKSLPAKEINGQ